MNRIHPNHSNDGLTAGPAVGVTDAGGMAAIGIESITGMTTTTITVVRPVVPV